MRDTIIEFGLLLWISQNSSPQTTGDMAFAPTSFVGNFGNYIKRTEGVDYFIPET